MKSLHSGEIQKRLAIYAAMAGALVAGSAQADPTQSPLNFPLNALDETDNNGGVSLDIDIDDNGDVDYNLYLNFSTNCTYNDGYMYFNGQYGGGIERDDSYYAGMITPGTTISDAMSFSSYSYLAGCSYGTGNFPPPSRGFVAVTFMSGQNLHYGYLDIETYNGSLGVTVHDACFESTPDTAIEAGACESLAAGNTRSVPVGGAIPLTLGILTLGAAALRRRRRQH